MNSLPSILALVGAVGATASIWWGRTGVRAANVVGWVGLLLAGFGLRLGAGGLSGLGGLEGGLSMQGVGPMVGMAACAALAVAPGWSSDEVGGAPAVSGALAIGVAATGLVAVGRVETGVYRQGSVLLAAYGSAWVAGLSATAGGACVGVGAWLTGADETEEGAQSRRVARRLALRGVLVAWLAWPIAALVHWRFLGTPAVGSPSEWWGLGALLAATGIAVASFQSTDSRPTRWMAVSGPVLVLLILAVGVAVPLSAGHIVGLSLPL